MEFIKFTVVQKKVFELPESNKLKMMEQAKFAKVKLNTSTFQSRSRRYSEHAEELGGPPLGHYKYSMDIVYPHS